MKFFNNMKLRNKLLFFYGSLLIFAVSLVGVLTYNKIEAYIFDQSSKSYSQTLEQVIVNIEYKMDRHQELLEPFLINHRFVAALNTQYRSPGDYSYQYLDVLRSIFALKFRYPSINNIIVYKDNDTLPDIGIYPDDNHTRDSHIIVDIAYAENTEWFDTYFSNFRTMDLQTLLKRAQSTIWTVNESSNIVSIIKPVIYNHESIVGIIELQMNTSEVFNDSIAIESYSDETFYVINDKGRTLFSSRKEGNRPIELEEKMIQLIADDAGGKLLLETEQPKKLILHRTNDLTGWTYIWELPLESLMLSSQSIRNFTIGILLSSIVVSFIIAIAMARVLTRRISSLAIHMEKQDDSVLEVGPDVDGRDEIGQLTRSYNRMIRRINDLIAQIRISESLQKEFEIKSLQAQINPHFLYNTLATINWMAADNQNEKISAMVENLAVFYRLSLNMGKEHLRISDEIKHVKAYLKIQQIRLEDRISVTYEIDHEILPYFTLKLILQPFVENAILHGAEHKVGTTHIVIKGYRSEDAIKFEIIDDGVGMDIPAHEQYENFGGYGIYNVNEKIQLEYGPLYGVKLFSELGVGTRVVITIPAQLVVEK